MDGCNVNMSGAATNTFELDQRYDFAHLRAHELHTELIACQRSYFSLMPPLTNAAKAQEPFLSNLLSAPPLGLPRTHAHEHAHTQAYYFL